MSPASLFKFRVSVCALEASGLLNVGSGFGSQTIFDSTNRARLLQIRFLKASHIILHSETQTSKCGKKERKKEAKQQLA